MEKHGAFARQQPTSVLTPAVAESGVPFVVGTAPMHSAERPAASGQPVLCTSWDEAVEKLGYSENWKDYTLCEFMYSHFKLFGCQPVIFCNVLDAATMQEAVPAAEMPVSQHKISLPLEALSDNGLIVKAAGEAAGEAYALGTDYEAYYSEENLLLELLEDGSCYNATSLSVAYNKAVPAQVENKQIVDGFESVEFCQSSFSLVPDLLCAPGFSHDSVVAAVMAAKAASIGGLFGAKALIDINCGVEGAKTYADVLAAKNKANLVDEREIVCWPMLRLGDYVFHQSTQLAGLIAQVDSGNNGCPYESPSNKNYQCDGLSLADGSEVQLTFAQANILNSQGVVTALNLGSGWKCWGNYTACYPDSRDVKDYFIPISRTFDWIGKTLIRTFWNKLDKPLNRRLLDTILDSCNIWLAGLVGSGYLLGARAEMLAAENLDTSLMAGLVTLHIYITPPSPMQAVDFLLEYDANYVTSALSS